MKKITALTALLCVCCLLLTGCGGKTIEGFEECVCPVEELSVPENAQLVALGEASHGNAEFQQLKLDVLKLLVEKDNVRAFALEADFGCCEVANRFIQGGEGTAQEAAAATGFQIYHTSQMAELMQWMRDYNESAPENEKLRFYGFDMQRVEDNLSGLLAYYEKVNPDVYAELSSDMNRLYGEEVHAMDAQIVSERRSHLTTTQEDLEQQREQYIAASSELEYEYACQYAACLEQNLELSQAGNYDYSDIRDAYMAENVDWILKVNQLCSGGPVMLSGHNGHVAMKGPSYTNMGSALEKKYGEDYFVIGTDFYKTTCNFPAGEGRANHSVCSDDPLAECMKGMDENMVYMDFASAAQQPAVNAVISAPMKMGSLGEGWAWYMKLLTQSYRIVDVPTELYDGMIFVYKATPTEIVVD